MTEAHHITRGHQCLHPPDNTVLAARRDGQQAHGNGRCQGLIHHGDTVLRHPGAAGPFKLQGQPLVRRILPGVNGEFKIAIEDHVLDTFRKPGWRTPGGSQDPVTHRGIADDTGQLLDDLLVIPVIVT